MSFIGTFESINNVGIYLDIDPLIAMLDPFDVPLQTGVDGGGYSTLSSTTGFEIKAEWLEETSLTPRATLAATAITADTVLTLGTGQALNFQSDDVISFAAGGEYVLVTGRGTTTDTITVTRAFNGSTATQQVNGALVVGVGGAPVEGGDPVAAAAVDRTGAYNVMEIFGPKAVTVSGTTRAIRKYGVADEYDHQVMMRLKEENVAFEQALLYGTRSWVTTSAALYKRTMGGAAYYISTNRDTTTTLLTEPTMLNVLQSCFDAGGSPNRIVVGSKQKRVISGFTSFGTIQVMRPDNQRGLVVDQYVSDFGANLVVLDRWCKLADLFAFNRDDVEIVTLRPFQVQALAKTGDADKSMVLGEKTVRWKAQRHAARMSALT